MPFAQLTTGARLHYEHLNRTGATRSIPVVAIHGLLGTGRKDLGHILDWLADDEGYEVIAPTLRGYGQSTPHPRDFPMRFYDRDTDDILAFFDALQLEKIHLLGYSDGGEVALIAAGKQPQYIATLAVIGSVGYFGQDVRVVVQGYSPGSQWIKPHEIDLHNIEDPDAFARGWQRSVIQIVDSGGDIALSTAPNITAPTLIMLGKRDTLNPAEYAQTFLDAINGDGHLVIFDSGHPVHNEQTERFRRVYKQHLQRA